MGEREREGEMDTPRDGLAVRHTAVKRKRLWHWRVAGAGALVQYGVCTSVELGDLGLTTRKGLSPTKQTPERSGYTYVYVLSLARRPYLWTYHTTLGARC